MGDIALQWGGGIADLAIVDDDVASEEGLTTAVILSLFLDRRAEDDDVLPAGDDRRGWWGDELAAVRGDRYGSRLWLLDRSKRTPDVGPLSEEYAREALAWLLEDRVTDQIDVVATVDDHSRELAVTVHRPGRDPITFRFSHVWEAEAAVDAPVNLPPEAGFTVEGSGLEVTVTSTATDTDGSIADTSYAWGDGTISAGPSHTYAAGGTYTIVQTVTDDAGATDTASVEVTVNAPPVAAFKAANAGLTVDFTDQSSDSDGSIVSWAWVFDTAAPTSPTSTAQHPSHTYDAAGTYTVSLTVTDDAGATDTVTASVEVVGVVYQATGAEMASAMAIATGPNLLARLDAAIAPVPDLAGADDDIDQVRTGVTVANDALLGDCAYLPQNSDYWARYASSAKFDITTQSFAFSLLGKIPLSGAANRWCGKVLGVNSPGWYLITYADRIRFTVHDGSSGTATDCLLTLADQDYLLLTAVLDRTANQQRLFVNGIAATGTPPAGSLSTTQEMRFGSPYSGGSPENYMAQVAFWDGAAAEAIGQTEHNNLKAAMNLP